MTFISIMKGSSMLYGAHPANKFPSISKGSVPAIMRADNSTSLLSHSQYLEEFSKVLAKEVRLLIAEIGRFREQKRSLQLCVCFFR
jgi:hypothetical protein